MFLSFIIALVALSISGIAAYYSIAGLAAIFAASVVPIIVMGAVLEVGKLATVVWLHQHWKKASVMMKMYLIPAVLVLMLITSMGIFGFLSKAHIDQNIDVGNVAVKVETIDNRIQREEQRIKQSQTVLDQLDEAVNTLIEYDRIRGKDGSIATREKQKPERENLAGIINDAQDKIAVLKSEKSVLTSKQVELEAEVGPIKYVAALIYGNEVSQENLSNSVRWMIIIIVSVFDPLAVVLVLAASSSYKWAKERKQESPSDDVAVLKSLVDEKEKETQKLALDYITLETQVEEHLDEIDNLKHDINRHLSALQAAENELDRVLFENADEELANQLKQAKQDTIDACDAADAIKSELDRTVKELQEKDLQIQICNDRITELESRDSMPLVNEEENERIIQERVAKTRNELLAKHLQVIKEKDAEIHNLREKIRAISNR